LKNDENLAFKLGNTVMYPQKPGFPFVVAQVDKPAELRLLPD
jgi:hypothetical protein